MSQAGTDHPISAKTFLGTLNALDIEVLITDPETDEILFANELMNSHYGVDYDPVGKRCWEVYQRGRSGRCAFCPIPRLMEQPDRPVEWEGRHDASGRCFRNTDSLIPWMDGRMVHLQQGVDITETKRTEETLNHRLRQQELMSAISQSFLAGDDVSVLFERALRMMGEFLRVDRVMLVRYADHRGNIVFAAEWYGNPAYRQERTITPSPEAAALIAAYLREPAGEAVCSDVVNDPVMKVLADTGMRAFLVVPVFVDGALWGSISLEMCTGPRTWTESDVYLGAMVSNMIGVVLLRERMAAQAREADDRMQKMLDAMPLACTLFTVEGQVLDCSGESPRMFHMSGKQEYIRRFWEISPALQPDGQPTREKIRRMLGKAYETGRETFEWQHCLLDGSPLPMEVTVVRLKWRGQYRLAGYARDLRQVKEQMAEIETAQDELRHAVARAEESARAKTDFLANMSHEIRTPMNVIIGMTKLARSSDDNERMRYCLDRVDAAANHLLSVINDILDMSKIEAGKLELNLSAFEVEDLLRSLCGLMGGELRQKRQELVVDMDRQVPEAVVADRQRLHQVLSNLLSNAVKFTPEGGKIILRLRGTGERGNRCGLLVEVLDNGIGVTEEQKERIWRSFEQADGSVSRRFGGTGLGLAISRNVVSLMGGTLDMESVPGKGSRFFFAIEVERAPAAQAAAPAARKGQGERILAVDKTPEVLAVLRELAAAQDIPCDTASSAEEVKELLKEGRSYGIAFLDWREDMEGLALARALRERWGDIEIVPVFPWEQEASDYPWGERFLVKPLLPSQVLGRIRERQARGNGEAQPAARGGEFKGRTILLAEDIAINREIVSSLLEGTGVAIVQAENGLEACRFFREEPARYDLILMDIHMPEMDGYQATREIRRMQVPKAAEVPIIAMTANVFREDVEKCLEAGMNAHIGKPVDLEEVLATLRRYL